MDVDYSDSLSMDELQRAFTHVPLGPGVTAEHMMARRGQAASDEDDGPADARVLPMHAVVCDAEWLHALGAKVRSTSHRFVTQVSATGFINVELHLTRTSTADGLGVQSCAIDGLIEVLDEAAGRVQHEDALSITVNDAMGDPEPARMRNVSYLDAMRQARRDEWVALAQRGRRGEGGIMPIMLRHDPVVLPPIPPQDLILARDLPRHRATTGESVWEYRSRVAATLSVVWGPPPPMNMEVFKMKVGSIQHTTLRLSCFYQIQLAQCALLEFLSHLLPQPVKAWELPPGWRNDRLRWEGVGDFPTPVCVSSQCAASASSLSHSLVVADLPPPLSSESRPIVRAVSKDDEQHPAPLMHRASTAPTRTTAQASSSPPPSPVDVAGRSHEEEAAPQTTLPLTDSDGAAAQLVSLQLASGDVPPSGATLSTPLPPPPPPSPPLSSKLTLPSVSSSSIVAPRSAPEEAPVVPRLHERTPQSNRTKALELALEGIKADTRGHGRQIDPPPSLDAAPPPPRRPPPRLLPTLRPPPRVLPMRAESDVAGLSDLPPLPPPRSARASALRTPQTRSAVPQLDGKQPPSPTRSQETAFTRRAAARADGDRYPIRPTDVVRVPALIIADAGRSSWVDFVVALVGGVGALLAALLLIGLVARVLFPSYHQALCIRLRLALTTVVLCAICRSGRVKHAV
jgi:hypothetical protein